MALYISFLSGFFAAIIGVFPPGLINMTASKVSLCDGRNRALLFVFGALIVIFFQTYTSVIFAQYINKHIEIIVLLREIGFFVFTGLTIYFLFFAKKQTANNVDGLKIKSKKSRFFLGMLISGINFFPIPYYAFVSITLMSYNLFTFDAFSILSLVIGVVFGSFVVFYFYVVFFNKLKSKTDYFIKNMNPIIAMVTGTIALITLIDILKLYC